VAFSNQSVQMGGRGSSFQVFTGQSAVKAAKAPAKPAAAAAAPAYVGREGNAPSTVQWVAWKGSLPAGTVNGGALGGNNVAICRGNYGSPPASYIGRVERGGCMIGGTGGNDASVRLSPFEVLANSDPAQLASPWQSGSASGGSAGLPDGWLNMGGKRALVVCQADVGSDAYPGYMTPGGCRVAVGGSARTVAQYRVLGVAGASTPSPLAAAKPAASATPPVSTGKSPLAGTVTPVRATCTAPGTGELMYAQPGQSVVSEGRDFCWKDTIPRGAGRLPQACPAGQERAGLLCYRACPAGMKRVGIDCHSVCPAGMRDDGLFCRATEYGRGVGYAIWNESKCLAENAFSGCEKWGAMWYPKCAPGYKNFGANICRPVTPDCGALKLKGRIDLSCAKDIHLGHATQAPLCSSTQQMDAGLCYDKCPAGYKGVGPVCWSRPPVTWVECGMGAAKDSATCAGITFGQVSSVAALAQNIYTFGTSAAATKAASTTEAAATLSQLKQRLQTLKEAYNAAKPLIKAGMTAKKVAEEEVKWVDGATVTEEDIARVAAQIAAVVDISGASGVVAAYTYPKCSKYALDCSVPPEVPRQVSQQKQPTRWPTTMGWLKWEIARVGSSAIPSKALRDPGNRAVCIARAGRLEGVPGWVTQQGCAACAPIDQPDQARRSFDPRPRTCETAFEYFVLSNDGGLMEWQAPAGAVPGEAVQGAYPVCVTGDRTAPASRAEYVGALIEGVCQFYQPNLHNDPTNHKLNVSNGRYRLLIQRN
jgi:hypothetical protein